MPCALTPWALLHPLWGGQQTLGEWRGRLIFPACSEKGGKGGRLPSQVGSPEKVGWAVLQGTSSPFPPAGSSNTWTGSPRGKRLMSSPSGNNRVFHGRTIAIKTVCQGLACKSTHAPPPGAEAVNAGGAARVRGGLSRFQNRPARERSLESQRVSEAVGRKDTHSPLLREVLDARRHPPPQDTSPATPELNPAVSTNLWLRFEQGCPIAQLQGVLFAESAGCPQIRTAPRFQSLCLQNETTGVLGLLGGHFHLQSQESVLHS